MREILIAAIAGPVLVLFISELFRYLNSKKEKEERFFYEVFLKRLELYEEIIKVTNNICDKEEPPQFKSKQELLDFYLEICNALAGLIYRGNIFGSVRVVGTLVMLRESQEHLGKLIFGLPEPLSKEAVSVSFKSCMPGAVSIKNRLLEFIREESGVYMIDNKTDELLRDIKKKQRFYKNVAKKK